MPLTLHWVDAVLTVYTESGAVMPYFGEAVLRVVVDVGGSNVLAAPIYSYKFRQRYSDYVSLVWAGLFDLNQYVGSGVLKELRLYRRSTLDYVFAYVSLGDETVSRRYVEYRLELRMPFDATSFPWPIS